MDFPNDPLTVFNRLKTYFKILKQWWATVAFVTQDGAIFHKVFKIFVVIDQKQCSIWG